MNKIFWIFFLCFLGCEMQSYAAEELDYYAQLYLSSPYQSLSPELYFADLPLQQLRIVTSYPEEDWEANRRRARIGGVIGAVIGGVTVGCASSYLFPTLGAYVVFTGIGAIWGGATGVLTGDAWYKR